VLTFFLIGAGRELARLIHGLASAELRRTTPTDVQSVLALDSRSHCSCLMLETGGDKRPSVSLARILRASFQTAWARWALAEDLL
jgi:hypothetical protein